MSDLEALQAAVRWRLLAERLRLERETAALREGIAKLRQRTSGHFRSEDGTASFSVAGYARTSSLLPGQTPYRLVASLTSRMLGL